MTRTRPRLLTSSNALFEINISNTNPSLRRLLVLSLLRNSTSTNYGKMRRSHERRTWDLKRTSDDSKSAWLGSGLQPAQMQVAQQVVLRLQAARPPTALWRLCSRSSEPQHLRSKISATEEGVRGSRKN